MKLGNKVAFGFSAVQAGQKSSTVNAEPQLVANSTSGKFVITAPVSKALGVAVGENVMFVNNIANVEQEISKQNPAIVEWANENGVDLTTREGVDAVLAEFTTWGIAKGIAEYDSKGNQVMSQLRYTKEDKQKYLDDHRAELVEANRDALVEAYGELSDEELGEKLTIDSIESPKIPSFMGSKTATAGSATGVGCQLNFTDTSIWNSLKADLGENKTKKNRVFKVLLDAAVPATIRNGFEDVEVMVYPIEYLEDTDPIVRGQQA